MSDSIQKDDAKFEELIRHQDDVERNREPEFESIEKKYERQFFIEEAIKYIHHKSSGKAGAYFSDTIIPS
jgi:hypothetical protein